MEEVGGRRESAQAIILAGFAVAIGMVVVAVYLNAMVFSANLDARGTHVDADEVAEISHLTLSETDYQMQRVQELNETPDEAEESYVTAMQDQNDAMQRLPSSDSAVVNIPQDSWDNQSAWQFVQEVSTAELDGDDDEANWTVATDIEDVFVLDFNKTKNYGDGENFTRIRTGDGSWELYVLANGTDPHGADDPPDDTVFVDDDNTLHEFEANGDWGYGDDTAVQIEILGGEDGNGAIGGQEENLQFPDDVDEIEIIYGDKSQGNYEMRIDGDAKSNGPCPTSDDPEPECGIPYEDVYWTTGIVHQSNYTLTHVHPRSTFEDDVSITHPREVER